MSDVPTFFAAGGVVRARLGSEWWPLGRVERVFRLGYRAFYRVRFSFSDPIGYAGDFSKWFRASNVRDPGPGPHLLLC